MEYYNESIASNKEVEVIHYNLDQSEKAMDNFMVDFEFPWPAIAYSKRERVKIANEVKENFVPCYVLVDAQGEVVAKGMSAAKKKIAELTKSDSESESDDAES